MSSRLVQAWRFRRPILIRMLRKPLYPLKTVVLRKCSRLRISDLGLVGDGWLSSGRSAGLRRGAKIGSKTGEAFLIVRTPTAQSVPEQLPVAKSAIDLGPQGFKRVLKREDRSTCNRFLFHPFPRQTFSLEREFRRVA